MWGDLFDGFYVVLDGVIEIGVVDVEGYLVVLIIVGGLVWFGEIVIIDGFLCIYDVIVLRDSVVFYVFYVVVIVLFVCELGFWCDLVWLVMEKLWLVFEVMEVVMVLFVL